ncbi:hypothetical protein H920_02456 [Fukomys damarensis]|uniref:Uncharacterized protein n=1 Tax=Fukomys damarensis TaxID=885580 RepID=A0A091DYB4_FUKDA|nr:hypothetical protein H920_02456 [Fukomys damarensis]
MTGATINHKNKGSMGSFSRELLSTETRASVALPRHHGVTAGLPLLARVICRHTEATVLKQHYDLSGASSSPVPPQSKKKAPKGVKT